LDDLAEAVCLGIAEVEAIAVPVLSGEALLDAGPGPPDQARTSTQLPSTRAPSIVSVEIDQT